MTEVTAYRVGTLVFPTIEEAQKSELMGLMPGGQDSPSNAIAVDWMVSHVDEVVAILTCHPKAKAPRKPRADQGKKRAAQSNQTPVVI